MKEPMSPAIVPVRSFLSLALLSLAAQASTTWYVDVHATGPGNGTQSSPYASLQYAIAQPGTLGGDTLLVAPGEYVENVDTLGKSLFLRSSGGPTQTTIRPAQAGNVVRLTGAHIEIEGFTVTGQIPAGSFTAAIHSFGSEGVVNRCIVRDNVGGTGILSAFDTYVYSSTVTGNGIGVHALQFGGYLSFEDSIATQNGTDVLADPGAIGVSLGHVFVGPGDAGFWDYARGDLHLRPGSVCIDAGDPAHAHDPDGTYIDLGALAYDSTYAPPSTVYCSGKTTSQGCVPAISAQGLAGASNPNPFWIACDQAVPQRMGLLVYGFSEQASPFQGGTLCVGSFHRTSAQLSSGSGPCSGHWQFDMNARIQSGVDPNLVPGALAYAQWWGRDPLDPAGFGSQLSDALRFGIAP
jgi:hypothetical protein